MKIEIYSNGPWIWRIVENGEVLNEEEACILFDWIISSMNTTQYSQTPHEEDEE